MSGMRAGESVMRVALVLSTLLLFPIGAVAQEPPKGPVSIPRESRDPITPSLRSATPSSGQVYVGERAPDFELDNSDGRPTKLSSFRGKWTLLVFADRRGQIAAMRTVEPELTPLDAQIVGVCHEKAQTLKALAVRDSLRYALLADVTGQVSAMYGLYDPARSETLPGFIVLDPTGVVRVALLGKLFPPDDIAKLARFIIGGS